MTERAAGRPFTPPPGSPLFPCVLISGGFLLVGRVRRRAPWLASAFLVVRVHCSSLVRRRPHQLPCFLEGFGIIPRSASLLSEGGRGFRYWRGYSTRCKDLRVHSTTSTPRMIAQ